MDNKDLMLSVKNLVVNYETDDGIVHAVNGVNLELKKKRTLGLVGETGAGKTTAALSVLKLIPNPPGVIKGGEIYLDGRDVLKLSEAQMEKIRGKDVSMIFQDPMTSLNPVLTIGEQISESISIHERLSKGDSVKRTKEVLELVGIPGERYGDYPHQFSGGMKQRVVIAIALSCNPKLLIADEPTTALDVTIQAQILEIMKDLKNKYEMSMLMITHDLGIVAEVCDEVSIMYAGSIVEHGTLEDIYDHTMHPYTEGLFNSLPDINDRKAELKPIPGLMPDPMEVPEGCAFAPRCAYADIRCSREKPALMRVSDSHYVVCAAYDDVNFRLKGRC